MPDRDRADSQHRDGEGDPDGESGELPVPAKYAGRAGLPAEDPLGIGPMSSLP